MRENAETFDPKTERLFRYLQAMRISCMSTSLRFVIPLHTRALRAEASWAVARLALLISSHLQGCL